MFGALLRCPKCHQYTPDRCVCKADPSLKGVHGGNCNREACQKPGALWYNKGMLNNKYYCASCAALINQYPLEDGTSLCSYKPLQSS